MEESQFIKRWPSWNSEEDEAVSRIDTYQEYADWAQRNGHPDRTKHAYWNRRHHLLTVGRNQNATHPQPVITAEAVQAMEGIDPASIPDKTEDEYERLFSFLEESSAARDNMSRLPVTARHRFPDNLPIGVCGIGDIHAGARIEYHQLRHDLELIRDTDGLYAIGMGDYIENTKPTLKSATALYSAVFANPKEQIEYIRRRLSICRGKWLGLLGGNHDAFDYRTAGIDRIADVARDLGTSYHGEAGATMAIECGDFVYHIVAKHQYTGQSRISKSNSARRLWDEWPHEWQNADVIMLAHLHECDTHITRRKGKMVAYLRGGTYKVDDDYATSLGFRSTWGIPMTIFYPDRRKIVPFDGALFYDAVEFLAKERERYRTNK